MNRRLASRSVYLDALRAVALVRVVVYHASDAWWVTAFTAMPLMFFIAGTLFAASMARRPGRQVIADRYRRIFIPYWAYLALMVGLWGALGVLGEITPANWVGFLFPVISMYGPEGPGADTALHLTWFALWYLQMHLVLSALGPMLRRAQQNRPRLLWGILGGLFIPAAVAAPPLAIAIFYIACWVVGYYQFDGTLEARLRTTWVKACLITGPVGIVAFLGFYRSAPMIAAIGVAFLGAFWLCLAIGLQPWIEPYLEGRRVRSVITWFSQRSLTIYLWHGVVLYAIVEWALPGSDNIFARVAWCALLLPFVVLALGWAEDLAARRAPQLWPRLPSARENDAGHGAAAESTVVDVTDAIDLTDGAPLTRSTETRPTPESG